MSTNIADLDENDLIREIAAMIEEMAGLEGEMLAAEKLAIDAARERDGAVKRLEDCEGRVTEAKAALRRLVAGAEGALALIPVPDSPDLLEPASGPLRGATGVSA